MKLIYTPKSCFSYILLAISTVFPTAAFADSDWPSDVPAVSGLVQIDGAMHAEDELEVRNDFLGRRARLDLSGDLARNWHWRAGYDFAEQELGITELNLSHELLVGRLTMGQQRVPRGLEAMTAPEHLSLMERSSPTEFFTPGYRLGAGYDYHNRLFTAQAMAFSRALGDDTVGNAPIGLALRGAWSPFNWPGELLHVGVSASYEDRQDEGLVRGAFPESRSGDFQLMQVGLDDASEVLSAGMELAMASGPFSAQAEYHFASLKSRDTEDPSFSGFYLQTAYVLTGESRGYSAGALQGINPRSRLGAWEAALRFSNLNLDESNVRQGVQNIISLGVNWYANTNLRFMGSLNWVDIDEGGEVTLVEGDDPVTVDDESMGIAQIRLEYQF